MTPALFLVLLHGMWVCKNVEILNQTYVRLSWRRYWVTWWNCQDIATSFEITQHQAVTPPDNRRNICTAGQQNHCFNSRWFASIPFFRLESDKEKHIKMWVIVMFWLSTRRSHAYLKHFILRDVRVSVIEMWFVREWKSGILTRKLFWKPSVAFLRGKKKKKGGNVRARLILYPNDTARKALCESLPGVLGLIIQLLLSPLVPSQSTDWVWGRLPVAPPSQWRSTRCVAFWLLIRPEAGSASAPRLGNSPNLSSVHREKQTKRLQAFIHK